MMNRTKRLMLMIIQIWNFREDSLMENFSLTIISQVLSHHKIKINKIYKMTFMISQIVSALQNVMSLKFLHPYFLSIKIQLKHRYRQIILCFQILLKIQKIWKTAFRQVINKLYLILSLNSLLKIRMQMMRLKNCRKHCSLKVRSRINWLLSTTPEK